MQLIKIKQSFFDSLNRLYPEQEIYSLFEQTSENFLQYNKIEIHQNLYKNIEEEAEKKILDVLNRLILAEPIQYILGHTQFFDCTISVDRRVLIPRPETEYLVDIILKDTPSEQKLTIVDLGTGSGCIAIALASKFASSEIYATDISANALSLARQNAAKNSVKVHFLQDDLFAPKAVYPKFDLIVSNPPYVRNQEKKLMHCNVLDFEPSLALFVEDESPLIFYKAIADFAGKNLSPQGILYLEINEYLGKETADLFLSSGYQQVEIRKDLNNKTRYIKACR